MSQITAPVLRLIFSVLRLIGPPPAPSPVVTSGRSAAGKSAHGAGCSAVDDGGTGGPGGTEWAADGLRHGSGCGTAPGAIQRTGGGTSGAAADVRDEVAGVM